MDKFIRDFFNSVLNDGGSPIYSTAPGKAKSSPDIKDSFKKLGGYFSKKAKPAEVTEAHTEMPAVAPEPKLPMVSQEEKALPKSEVQPKV